MALGDIGEMMRHARRHGYAIGYFESWNIESLQGVLDAAEETRSPIIIGFNGEFLSRGDRKAQERLTLYAALGKAAAESVGVPCGLIFNECPRDEWVRLASRHGFNLVMPSDPAVPYDQYVHRVGALTQFAHQHGVSVEAEVGELPCGVSGGMEGNGSLTDADVAARFVEATDVDLLAVSVGNVHISLNGEHGLDMARLAEIRKRVDIPLVLHGGTGIAADPLRGAISLGVVKVNYGTYLKQRYLTAIRAALNNDMANPHELLGIGGDADVMVAGRLAVRQAVLERIGNLGCCGKA